MSMERYGRDPAAPWRVQELAGGVFAVLHEPGAPLFANAGLVDLGDRTLLFDTGMTPAGARALCALAVELTGRAPSLVVNSHYHNDHVWGNCAVPAGAQILATGQTRKLIQSAEAGEFAAILDAAPEKRERLAGRLAGEQTAAKRTELQWRLNYYEAICAALPELALRLPDVTFEQSMTIFGTRRSVELLTLGGGHTASNALLVVPDCGVLFMGDLLTVQNHPYLPDGDPGEWERILDQVTQRFRAARHLVPGHGPVGAPAELALLRTYLAQVTELAVTALVYGALNAEEAEEKVRKLAVPPLFTSWASPLFFADNLRFLYRRLLAAYADG